MAGDWIKMRAALTTCPKVAAMARAISLTDEFVGLSRHAMRLLVVGGLHAVWAAVNEHTSDGVMANAYPEDVDDIAGIDGFGSAMRPHFPQLRTVEHASERHNRRRKNAKTPGKTGCYA